MITFGGMIGMGEYSSEGTQINRNGELLGTLECLDDVDGMVENTSAVAAALNHCQGMTIGMLKNKQMMDALSTWYVIAEILNEKDSPSSELRERVEEMIEDAERYRGLCK